MVRTIRGEKAERFAYLYGKALQENRCSLWDCYRNPSTAKVASFNEIRDYALQNGYRNVRIVTFNSFQYTVGYRNDKELIIETANNIYRIPIETTTILHYVNGDF